MGDPMQTRSQGSISELTLSQLTNFESLARLKASIGRLKPETVTMPLLQTRTTLVKELWQDIRLNHVEYVASLSPQARNASAYVQQNEFGQHEEIYFEMLDTLANLASQVPAPAPTAPTAPTAPILQRVPSTMSAALPKIDLPKFHGDVTAWDGFCDLFTSLVAQDQHLSNVQKLHYLKNCLIGEPLTVIQNIDISDQNFELAWSLIKSRYANRHLLIFSQVSKLLNLSSVSAPKPCMLRQLIDQTAAILGSLRKLKEPVDQWDTLIVVLTVLRLDAQTRRDWEQSVAGQEAFPTFKDLEKYILLRIQSLHLSEFKPPVFNITAKSTVTEVPRAQRASAHMSSTSVPSCLACNASHVLAQCDKFKHLSATERLKLVQSRRYCYNCLKGGHTPFACRHKRTCGSCSSKHHALLHEALQRFSGEKQRPPAEIPAPESSSGSVTPGISSHLTVPKHTVVPNSVLLATACVQIASASGRYLTVRALIDPGSEKSFIAESAVQAIQAVRQSYSAVISGVGNQTSCRVRQSARIYVRSRYSDHEVTVDALILPKVTGYAPRKMINVTSWPHLAGLQLADQPMQTDLPITLILGADVYGIIMSAGVRKINNGPLAQRTIFGWILSGSLGNSQNEAPPATICSMHVVSNVELHSALEKFWSIEELPKQHFLSANDQACESLFRATTSRDSEGRFTVALPFIQGPPIDLGNSYDIALRAYTRMERRLARDPALAKEYHAFLEDYLALGHMTPYDRSAEEQNCYIPHHPVVKNSSTSTKVRVVFNASCPTSNGRTLNDNLLVGPKLHQELPAILLRWRLHRYVCTADVTKMFRQILVQADHTRYQLILWRPTSQDPIREFRLLTVTYGTASAPYLSLRVLQQLAEDEAMKFPLAVQEIPRNIYVDDVLFGAASIPACLQVRDEIIGLTNSGCLPLKKWCANNSALLGNIPLEDCEINIHKSLQEDEQLKILGLSWSPVVDALQFPVDIQIPDILTKRTLLSHVSKLFDPLGLVAPVVIVAKVLLQRLWSLGIDWDSSIPDEVAETWRIFCADLQHLSSLQIPRWVEFLPSCKVQVHGFCDASQAAYAAVVYLRVTTETATSVYLIVAKTRVAPAKSYVTIPRLELCGADLLSQLLQWTVSALNIKSVSIFAWSDSSVTLHWIAGCPSRWNVFVANRVSRIQQQSTHVTWKHVPTEVNPADLASRGMTAEQLMDSPLWWRGPCWLQDPESSWPDSVTVVDEAVNLEERTVRVHVAVPENVEWDLATRFSDWGKLLRVTALVLRFVSRIRSKISGRVDLSPAAAVLRARHFWYQYVQRRVFAEDWPRLEAHQELPRGNSLSALSPQFDAEGILRVSGRLQNSAMSHDQMHPIILADHPVTRLILRHVHLQTLHGGPQLMLRVLREQYWVLRARNLVRGLIQKCVACVRQRATLLTQRMAALPTLRVHPAPPFQKVGIDYAGPFMVRALSGRGRQSHKAYLALFICLSVKAVHLELVMNLSTAAFLAAFRRFCARRGVPLIVLSDNGTNFQGGDRAIRCAFQRALKDPELGATMDTDGISWRFIPPSSPHFGGLWESGVRSVKHHLRRVVGTHTLTIEEFQTLLCQIEACLNSRPLIPLTEDPDDLSALTPAHFLIGRSLFAIPEPTLLDVPESHLSRWQLVQQMRDHFWKAWRKDYVVTLQKRVKWRREQPNIEVGALVLLQSDNYPPAKWPLGRVTHCTYGTDGLVRICKVKTAQTELVRPVHKLCKLSVE